MSDKKYIWKINIHFKEIEKVELIKETEKTVWVKGYPGSQRKISNMCAFVNSKQEGIELLIKRAKEEVEQAKNKIVYAEGYLKLKKKKLADLRERFGITNKS